LARHHSGDEKSEQLQLASQIYHDVDEFGSRREIIFTDELTSSMNRLRIELQICGVGVESEISDKAR
jgi:hypothetical protein